MGGHNGVQKTFKTLFYWKGMQKMVRDSDIRQRNKPDLTDYPGLLQPLPIPTRIWSEISMDLKVRM